MRERVAGVCAQSRTRSIISRHLCHLSFSSPSSNVLVLTVSRVWVCLATPTADLPARIYQDILYKRISYVLAGPWRLDD